MNSGNVTETLGFDPEAVKNSIENIRHLTGKLDSYAIALKEAAQKSVNSGIRADFGRDILQKLETYYNEDLRENMAKMSDEASKLENALPEIVKFAQESISE